LTVSDFVLALIAILVAAKLFGEIAERLGQPAVLGEMIGGIVIGVSGLHLVDPHSPILHLMAELGVVLLLFLIGLETDMRRLLASGGPSTAVATVGVILPLVSGLLVGRLLGYPFTIALLLGATLTATSVGITARVLSDLGRLKSEESQIILGAAVLDDILGLILLAIVGGLAVGKTITAWTVAKIVISAFGFIALALVLGSMLAPRIVAVVTKLRVGKALLFASIVFAFGLAWLADLVGAGMIIGAFAAGVVLARTKSAEEIEHEVRDLSQFFIPIFFVMVGAAVDLRSLNPFNSATRPFLMIGLLLTAVGIAGKVMAGFVAPRRVKRLVIGVGMVPRGEVGLIFAQLGLSTGLLTAGLYSSLAVVVVVTTFLAPPALRALLKKEGEREESGIVSGLVTNSMCDKPGSRKESRATTIEQADRP
jgi:Kef-type K+ transport system membrane component KefB